MENEFLQGLTKKELKNLLEEKELNLESKKSRICNLRVSSHVEKLYSRTCCLGTLALGTARVVSDSSLIDNGFLITMFINSMAFVLLRVKTYKKIKSVENDIKEVEQEIEVYKNLIKRFNCSY